MINMHGSQKSMQMPNIATGKCNIIHELVNNAYRIACFAYFLNPEMTHDHEAI